MIMKSISKIILILLLVVPIDIHSQLNEFIVQWQFGEGCPPMKPYTTPWRQSSNKAESFFKEMKNTFHFNTVLFETTTPADTGDFYIMAKNAGLNSILVTDNLYRKSIGSQKNFNDSAARVDLVKYADSAYRVIGYIVSDEPHAKSNCDTECTNSCCYRKNLIEDLPDYTNAIGTFNPLLLRFANLLPLPYDDEPFYRNGYIQKYIDEAKPNLLSFDDYPIYDSGNVNFFKTLYYISLKSVENSIPFIYVLTPYEKHSDFNDTAYTNNDQYSAKNIPEFNYGIYAALAYGAKGIAYWPGFQWVKNAGDHEFALKYADGELNYLAALHQMLIDHSDLLLSLNFASAYHVSTASTIITGGTEQIHDFCSWSNFANDKYAQQIFSNLNNPVVSGGSIPTELAITFLTNKSGQIYFWLFNKSLTSFFNLSVNSRYSQIYDVLNEELFCIDDDAVSLAPGEGKLFTTVASNKLTTATSITNYSYAASTFFPFESAYQFNLGTNGSSGYSVVFNDSATKSFMAEQIDINNVKIAEGSTVRLKAYTNCNTITETRSAVIKDEQNINSVQKEESGFSPSVYPNPTKNYFTLSVDLKENEKMTVIIYNEMGKLIKSLETTTPQTTISLSDQLSGLYLVHFSKEGKAYNYKILKQ